MLAAAIEVGFLALSICVFRHPARFLASEPARRKYGAFYEKIRLVYPAVATAGFHNVRLFLLVGLLVSLSSFPTAQSLSYLVLSTAGLLWDFWMSPYDGRMLRGQMLFLDVAKVLAGAGYVGLTVSLTSKGTAEWDSKYEIVVILVGVFGGFMLAAVQQAWETYNIVRKWCCVRENTDKVACIETPTGAVTPTASVPTDQSQNCITYTQNTVLTNQN